MTIAELFYIQSQKVAEMASTSNIGIAGTTTGVYIPTISEFIKKYFLKTLHLGQLFNVINLIYMHLLDTYQNVSAL